MKLEWNERTNETRVRIIKKKKKRGKKYRLNEYEGKRENSQRWDACVCMKIIFIERKEEENKISKG